jgi:hypothetical protein
MKERKCTGHTLGSEKSIATEAFTCNPQKEKKKAGCPRNTWKRTT